MLLRYRPFQRARSKCLICVQNRRKAPSVRPLSYAPLTSSLSPYASPLITTLYFGDGPQLIVPALLINKIPMLSHRIRRDMTLHLEDIPGDVGHVLVHYFYTGMYQSLKPKGLIPHEKTVAEFTTSVRVYTLAQDYKLSNLRELAKGEMERLGHEMHVTQIHDVMRTVRPVVRVDDKWLHDYLKSLARRLIDDPPESLGGAGLDRTIPFSTVLLMVMVELYHEKTSSLQSNFGSLLTREKAQSQGEPTATFLETELVCQPNQEEITKLPKVVATNSETESALKKEPTTDTKPIWEYMSCRVT